MQSGILLFGHLVPAAFAIDASSLGATGSGVSVIALFLQAHIVVVSQIICRPRIDQLICEAEKLIRSDRSGFVS